MLPSGFVYRNSPGLTLPTTTRILTASGSQATMSSCLTTWRPTLQRNLDSGCGNDPADVTTVGGRSYATSGDTRRLRTLYYLEISRVPS